MVARKKFVPDDFDFRETFFKEKAVAFKVFPEIWPFRKLFFYGETRMIQSMAYVIFFLRLKIVHSIQSVQVRETFTIF